MIKELSVVGKAVLFLGLAVLAAGCSKSNSLDSADGRGGRGAGYETAEPGSERDFTVNVGDRVHFIVDQSTLTPEGRETLNRQAAWLREYPQVTIQVEGHSDERGTREYNIALSARRATTVREYLLSQGIQSQRVTTSAYGKERPVALCDAESCWAQNRRAVTVITGGV